MFASIDALRRRVDNDWAPSEPNVYSYYGRQDGSAPDERNVVLAIHILLLQAPGFFDIAFYKQYIRMGCC